MKTPESYSGHIPFTAIANENNNSTSECVNVKYNGKDNIVINTVNKEQ